MGRKKSKKAKKLKNKLKQPYTQKIIDLFRKAGKRQLNHKQISSHVGAKNAYTRELVTVILEQLQSDNLIIQSGRGKYVMNPDKAITVEGTLDFTRTGAAYLVTDRDGDNDIYIPAKKTGSSLHGDRVVANITSYNKNNPEGEVIEVIQRGFPNYVGILEKSKNFAFVIPTNKRIHVDFFIPQEQLDKAENGQKVIVEILDWPESADNPFAKIVMVLGEPGDNEVEMHAILAEYGLPVEFPDKVLNDAEKIDVKIGKDERKGRKDFRKVPTFTIDPDDAKDFDDALSFRKTEKGLIEVGIHIADVSHYLPAGTDLDNEARKRATSVYLVDRVVPMLPEVLSNAVCSLRPNEEKLCFSAVFELNDKAEVQSQWIGRTLINSDRRFTYDEAQALIEGSKGDFSEEVNELNRLAKIMRERRLNEGAIDFGGREIKFKLDEKGKPIGVYEKHLKEANKLIEEFMLLANRKVAEFISKNETFGKKTFVYRVHDLPDPEKLQMLRDFVKHLGYKLAPTSEEGASYAINKLLKDVKGKPEEDAIKQMAIRSMAKAYYTTQNIGHYGLAFEHYTHFTSPIRRYPDVMVHRLLDRYLSKGKSYNSKDLERNCKHSSTMEKRAVDAERDSIKYKQVEFMLDKIGQEFDGFISGLTRWGIFVELKDNHCEGMVHISTMTDDQYYFDESKYQVVGMRYKEVYHFGDPVKVIVKGADLELRQLDFVMS